MRNNQLSQFKTAIRNLNLWQFVAMNMLLIATLFIVRQCHQFLYWEILLFAFLFLPLLSFILAIKNQKYSYKLLKTISIILWTMSFMIFAIFNDFNNNTPINLSIFLNTSLFCALFFLIQHILLFYVKDAKKTNTPLFIILMVLATTMDLLSRQGLFGVILAPIFTVGLVIWTSRLILITEFIKRHLINIIASTLFIIGFEFNANYQNTKSKIDGQAIAKQITTYHKTHQTYPNKDSINIKNPNVRYHTGYYEKDKQPYAMLYYSDFKIPLCRYFYRFEKEEWDKECLY